MVLKSWLKIYWRTEENKAHKRIAKGILVEWRVNYSLIEVWYKKHVFVIQNKRSFS